jgi:nucleoside 2-deoxyribosyltransferase
LAVPEGIDMNCFVIMPFSRDFDDVYAAIKSGVEGTISHNSPRCFRLDETRPAGWITDRLLNELQAASLCVADLTETRPNVMWELGYAMALDKPTIIVMQDLRQLPFDLKDMQSLQYDRSHLNSSLSQPLRRMIVDTFSQIDNVRPARENPQNQIIAELRGELAEVKSMVAEAVKLWHPKSPQKPSSTTDASLKNLEGAWFNVESSSHLYAAVIDGDLVAPYCYGGDDELVGVYFGWQRVGDRWFARFSWLTGEISGFAFLKQQSVDLLTGAWWMEEVPAGRTMTLPPDGAGVPARLQRKIGASFPEWATRFLDDVRKHGLASRITRTLQLTRPSLRSGPRS